MEMFAFIEQWGLYLAAILVTLLAVLLPMSAYAAQKWAHKTYLEVRSINAKLSELLEAGGTAGLRQEPERVPDSSPKQRREPTLGQNHTGAAASGTRQNHNVPSRGTGARTGGRLSQ
jgi:hypothetical protein